MNAPAPATVTAEIPPGTRSAVRELLAIAVPTIATMASYTLMQFVDGLMVSRIEPPDPVYLAAQGNGGIWSWVPMSIFAGLTGVVNTYVAQHLGAGKPERGPAYAWNALWIGVVYWLLILVPLAFAMPSVFAAMGHDPELVRLESAYVQILLFGGVITMVSRSFSQFFYGMHRPGITLAAAIAGNLVNLLGNYTLIFGNFGFPELGVAGAAWGTLLGTTVEMLIPLAVFLSPSFNRRYATRAAWRFSPAHFRDILRLGWPPALMHGNEIICWAIFMTYFAGHFGKVDNTAGWIALRYMHLSFMPAVGMSFALTAVVGKCLGAGRPDLAAQRARLGIGVCMAYMTLCGIVFVVFRRDMIGFFLPEGTSADEAAAIIALGAQIMIVAAIFQAFDGLGISLIGILRGAGDTVWPGVVTAVMSWVFIVGGGAALTFGVPQWGSLGPWIAAGAYIIALGVALGWRFSGGAWKRRDLLKDSAGARGLDETGDAIDLARSPVVEVER